MARLKKCGDCGHMISKKAEACPSCGAKPAANRSGILWLGAFIVIGVLFNSILSDSRSNTNNSISAEEDSKALAELRKIRLQEFKKDPVPIIAQIADAMEKGDYARVAAQTDIYLSTNNEQIVEMNHLAKDQLQTQATKRAAVEKKQAVSALLEELKSVPAANSKRNMDLYAQLVALDPKTKRYLDKYKYYERQLNAETEAKALAARKSANERQRRESKFGKAPIASGWDGSYRAVEVYLESVANDPVSLEMDGCTKVYYTEDGWLVGCDYRARNGFGGMVRQSNWFLISHNRVVKMKEAGAYSQ